MSGRGSVLRLGLTSNRPIFCALYAEVALLALFPGVTILAEEARKAIVRGRGGAGA